MTRLPPPIVFVIALGLMSLFPHLQSVAFFRPLAVVLGVFATITGGLSVWAFYQAKTTINPRRLDATSALVQHGIFRFSRNPMYLSLAILLIAFVLWRGNLWALSVLPLFISYIQIFQILPEERMLTEKFGRDYQDYCARVRRWI